jgi:uncharacterized protein YcgI (DUF1989 family)
MKPQRPDHPAPDDAQSRRDIAPVVCYPPETLPVVDLTSLRALRGGAQRVDQITIAPRSAGCIAVPAGAFFRITYPDGPQVGDLNLWAAGDLNERFYSGKTRALHGTHLSSGDRMWSCFPYMRPMATIVEDSLDWYGFDSYGGAVHDVIGTRCDPYTGRLLSGGDYHYCCHSNLTRALAAYAGMSLDDAEPLVHDVLNVFMCTGFTRDTGQYFMKASPVRAGDYLEFYAQIDLIVGLSACPGGDCSAEHSSDAAACYPLGIEVWDPGQAARKTHVIPPFEWV